MHEILYCILWRRKNCSSMKDLLLSGNKIQKSRIYALRKLHYIQIIISDHANAPHIFTRLTLVPLLTGMDFFWRMHQTSPPNSRKVNHLILILEDILTFIVCPPIIPCWKTMTICQTLSLRGEVGLTQFLCVWNPDIFVTWEPIENMRTL